MTMMNCRLFKAFVSGYGHDIRNKSCAALNGLGIAVNIQEHRPGDHCPG